MAQQLPHVKTVQNIEIHDIVNNHTHTDTRHGITVSKHSLSIEEASQSNVVAF